MASPSLLILLDDIAAVLDDVATMTKLATKKTAGVLTDDLAVNAQQVTGVQANRELPVIWSVAKGSLINKLLIIPAALLISQFAPWLMMILLIIGGVYLCFEGAEKVYHTITHRHHAKAHLDAIQDKTYSQEEIKQLEKDKIKGAIRTDFILSAEIIVISLNVLEKSSLTTQISALLCIALFITVGVYGLVAAIIKLDDLGYWLLRGAQSKSLKEKIGLSLIHAAPYLMKFLGFVGTIAMFLVGGGIIIGEIPPLIHLQGYLVTLLSASFLKYFVAIAYSLILGAAIGFIVVAIHNLYLKMTNHTHVKDCK